MQYRAEIDGLRAFAVVPVILFHFGFHEFSGGFVGVDIFFVISGYLITSIIVQEKLQGTFSIVNFYERRARRILPVLFAVILICIPVAWNVMLPHQLHDFGQSIVATSLFLSNIFFFMETDYFNDFAETAPLLHTWSLAVEEQYYILFPIIVSMVFWVSSRLLGAVMLLIAVVSFVIAESWLNQNPSAAFYLLPSRAWELMLGGLIAILPNYPKLAKMISNPSARLQNEVGSSVGLLMILASIFLLDKNTRFPGVGAVLPVVGTCLVILFADHQTLVKRLLSQKPLVWIGLLSYSLYIWHQPLLAFFRLEYGSEPNLPQVLALLALVTLLSWFSWKYIEAPFRNRTTFSRQRIFAYSLVGMSAFVTVGYVSHYHKGFLEYRLAQYEDKKDFELIDREASVETRKKFLREKIEWNNAPYTSRDKNRALILGDSLSADLFITFELNESLSKQYEAKRKKLDDPCMSDLIAVLSKQSDLEGLSTACQRDIGPILRDGFLEQTNHILIAASWQFDTYESGAELARFLRDQYDVTVTVVGNAMFQDMVSLSFEMLEDGMDKEERRQYVYNNIRLDRMGDSGRLKELVDAEPDIQFIDKMPFFCDELEKACDLFASNGEAYLFDNVHLTMTGARAFGRWVEPQINP